MAERQPPGPAPLGQLRAAFERTGSPHWIMATMQRLQLDQHHGFTLRVDYLDDQMRAERQSTEQALIQGQVDFIDTDWISLARYRRQGLAISAVYPYGRILGGLLVNPEREIDAVPDLSGKRLGVVSAQDKNWQLTRCYAQRNLGIDLDDAVELVEAGSKTRLRRWLEQGQVDAALVYWHQIPALSAQGFCLLLDIPALLPALGFAPTPTTFFVFNDALIDRNPALIQAFIAALNETLQRLQSDDSCWQWLARELLQLDCPDQREALRRLWRGRIAQPWQAEQLQALEPLYQLLQQSSPSEPSRLPSEGFRWELMQPPGRAEARPAAPIDHPFCGSNDECSLHSHHSLHPCRSDLSPTAVAFKRSPI